MNLFNKKNKEKKNNKFIPYIFLILFSFAIGYLFATYNFNSVNGKTFKQDFSKYEFSEYFNFELYEELWQIIKNQHVDKNKIDESELFYGSLKGMTSSIGDPYTMFLDPEGAKELLDDLSGSFEGIGAEIGVRDDMITVIAPLSDRPAMKAGIRAGDVIYAIDGASTMSMSLTEAVRKIRGPKDTEVVLTILREEEERPIDISIIRSTIIIESLKWERLENNIFLIEISNFHEDTLRLFNQAIMEILKVDAKGIILDLRNNPGGYLDKAIDIASEWVKEGPVVVEQRSEGRRNEFFANGLARLNGIPTVVLVNRGSASASEILAGALRDYNLATIVGEQTFGKGSVQSLMDLSDGSSIKITVSKWLTPEGDYIDKKGVEPDIIVEFSKEDFENEFDPQMDKALELLLK